MKEMTERADAAEIPYHLWKNQIQAIISRVMLPEDWETKVTPLRNMLMR